MPEKYVLLPLEVEEVQLQVILEGLVYPSEVEEASLLVKKADGKEIYKGMDVGVVEHLPTLLEDLVLVGALLMDVWMEVGVVEHFHTFVEAVVAVGFLLIDLRMEVVAPKKSLIMYQVKAIIIEWLNWSPGKGLCS